MGLLAGGSEAWAEGGSGAGAGAEAAIADVFLDADADDDQPATETDLIIVTGTRRVDRTVAESPAPIDVFTATDLTRQGTADMNQLLQNLVPSFSVSRYAIADGSSFVRPPNLRGLPPDETLVLVNGKRRHRAALVQINIGGLSDGSQSADLAQIPAIAVDRIEVLRDGASAQYGSDAIAGVINFGLKRDTGFTGYLRYGQFYKGDGEDFQAAANAGFALGENGFINFSGEYIRSKKTSRGVTRAPALQLSIEHPDIGVPELAQRYGNPDLEAERFFVNGGFDLGDSEVYFFGNYGHSYQEESFNYRAPLDTATADPEGNFFGKSGIYQDIYTAFVDPSNARAGQPVFYVPRTGTDVAGNVFAGYTDIASCSRAGVYNFACLYSGGFTPLFFGKIDDISGTGGYKGSFDFGLTYDLSASYGQNRLQYYLTNTMNPSLGPTSPTEFYVGSLEQRETNFNLDLSYPIEAGFASPITVAFGGEFRRESYEIGLGDPGAYAVGPYTGNPVYNSAGQQIFIDGDGNIVPAGTPGSIPYVTTQPVGSNGFPGYGPTAAGSTSRTSKAVYIDVETDVTDALSVGLAGRYEDFSDFGSTTTGKVSARYAFSPVIAIRGTASTGFRAPTPGQVNTTSIATVFNAGDPNPVEQLTLPATDPVAQFIANTLGSGYRPLTPEESTNISAGVVLTPMAGATVTVDYYNIKVKDRIGTSQSFNVTDDLRDDLQALGLANYATVGTIQYLSNAFDTRTQGLDIVGSYFLRTDGGSTFNTTVGFNWNETKITKVDSSVIGPTRAFDIENNLPKYRLVVTEVWTSGPISVLGRMNWYGKYKDAEDSGSPAGFDSQTFSSEFVFDLEATYTFNEKFTLTAGAQNIFNNYPEKDLIGGVFASTGGRFTGDVYPDISPFGFNGGFWYLRAGVKF